MFYLLLYVLDLATPWAPTTAKVLIFVSLNDTGCRRTSSLRMSTRRIVIAIIFLITVTGIFLVFRRSIPYNDRAELLSGEISIDSVWTLGPATVLYDRKSGEQYWFKSLTSIEPADLDTLKARKAKIRYMKFFDGFMENRIFRIEVDSIVVFDQVVTREKGQ